MHVPTKAFKDLKPDPDGSDNAMKMVQSMTEDQVRYALWATLVMGFGCPTSNLPGLVAASPGMVQDVPSAEYFRQGMLLLGQAGMPSQHKVLRALQRDVY